MGSAGQTKSTDKTTKHVTSDCSANYGEAKALLAVVIKRKAAKINAPKEQRPLRQRPRLTSPSSWAKPGA